MALYQLSTGALIIRTSDGACIPKDPANTDYQGFLAWVAQGNTASPMPQPTPEEIKQQKLKALDGEYNPKFDTLTLAWATAYMSGDTKTADARKADKAALVTEYNTKKGAIKNG